MDFGIARVIRENFSSAIGTTEVGTPHFMAPEQGIKNSRSGEMSSTEDVMVQ